MNPRGLALTRVLGGVFCPAQQASALEINSALNASEASGAGSILIQKGDVCIIVNA